MAGDPFKIDWTSKEAVVAYADTMGPGITVYSHPERSSYNITHTNRTDLYRPEWVIYQT